MRSINAEIPDALVDVSIRPDGYIDPKGEDTSDNFCGLDFVLDDFPEEFWIDPNDWKERAEINDEYGLWAQDHRAKLGRWSNQSPTHECTCHSLVQGAEAAIRRQLGLSTRRGIKGNICLSMLSIYSEANPRKWGGANCISVLRIAGRRGFIPEPIRGQNKIFRHTLHGTNGRGVPGHNSSGKWVAVRDFPSGWKETAKGLRVQEAVTPRTFEQAVCLVLQGFAVNVGRNGHAVPWDRIVWRGGNSNPLTGITLAYTDSYEVVRYDSYSTARRAIGGSSCITLMSTCETFEDHFYDS